METEEIRYLGSYLPTQEGSLFFLDKKITQQPIPLQLQFRPQVAICPEFRGKSKVSVPKSR